MKLRLMIGCQDMIRGFLVGLCGEVMDGTEVDHILVVDSKRNLICNFAEKTVINLDSRSFNICVGHDAELVEFKEMRKLS